MTAGVGVAVGAGVGEAVGDAVGDAVGEAEGDGEADGLTCGLGDALADGDGVTAGSGPTLGTTLPIRGRSYLRTAERRVLARRRHDQEHHRCRSRKSCGAERDRKRPPSAFGPFTGVLRRPGVGTTLRRDDDALGREARPRRIGVDERLEEQQ